MNTTMSAPRADAGAEDEGMEWAACPRCGLSEGETVAEGRDFLHGLPGRFFAWQCSHCGLRYQNPRPTEERLAQLYPPSYAPHTGAPVEQPPDPRTAPGWKAWLRSRPVLNRVWPFLGRARAALGSLPGALLRRAGLGAISPSPAEWEFFLREEMGYPGNRRPASATVNSLPRRIRREYRRRAGIDLIPHYVAGGRLLEIGCANGDRLKSYSELGWEHLAGIELVEQAAEQARRRGFQVVCAPVEAAISGFEDGRFDVVVSSMVLEHLCNPFEVIKAIAGKLKPGGEFLFSTVTLDALDARLYGPYWSGYDFPRHMVYLRTSDIKEMVAQDFEIVELFHQNAPIDFLRPAMWRRPEKRLSDRLIARLANSPQGLLIGDIIARMGQTCRVSVRCRKR